MAQQLIALENCESKILYYEQSSLKLNDVDSLLQQPHSKRERLELLFFWLERQFFYDISIGQEYAKESLNLARFFKLKLHEAIALGKIATVASVHHPRNIAHQYADSALAISVIIKDQILQSEIYYTKYVIDLVNESHDSGVTNLLKCVELAEKYAHPSINRTRQIRLMMVAYDWNNIQLFEAQIKKINFEQLDEEDKAMYLIYQGHYNKQKGNIDAAVLWYKKATKYKHYHAAYLEVGKWHMHHGSLDSAIYYIQKSLEGKDPRASFFDVRYINLAEIYKQRKQYALVVDYYKKAIKETERLSEKSNEANYYSQLAAFYLEIGELDSANKYGLKAYQLSSKNNYTKSIKTSTLVLANMEEQQGNFKAANAYLKVHLEQVKLNNDAEVVNQLKKAEINREIDYWIDLGNQKIEKAEQFRNLIIIIALLLLLLLTVGSILLIKIRRALKSQKTLNKRVQDQKDEIASQGEALIAVNEQLSTVNEALESRVSERTKALKTANDQLSDYNHRLEQYANLTAHNLRGPLANILGLVNLHHAQVVEDFKSTTTIDRIYKSAKEIDHVIRELSDLMDVEAVDDIKVQKVDLAVLAQDLQHWLKRKIGENEVALNTKVTVSEVDIKMQFLKRTLKELLYNAYKYRDPQKALEIDLSIIRQGDDIKIKIADNGIGINLEKYKNNIFQLHQRFHAKLSGRGVGLYLVKRHIEALSGKITVESSLGKGTIFTILIPMESTLTVG